MRMVPFEIISLILISQTFYGEVIASDDGATVGEVAWIASHFKLFKARAHHNKRHQVTHENADDFSDAPEVP